MKRVSWLIVGVAAAGLATVAACAQEPTPGRSGAPQMVAQLPAPGAPERFGQMSDAERAKMREQMMMRMLDEAGLTPNEKAAAKKALTANDEPRRALSEQLTKLRRVANKAKPSDKELREALAAYRGAVAQYRRKVESQDRALAKQLSLRGQVRCLSLGILDNGLGGMGPGVAGPPGGLSGPGGPDRGRR